MRGRGKNVQFHFHYEREEASAGDTIQARHHNRENRTRPKANIPADIFREPQALSVTLNGPYTDRQLGPGRGSIEPEQDLDPEEARAIIDPALKLMIEARGGLITEVYCPELSPNFVELHSFGNCFRVP